MSDLVRRQDGDILWLLLDRPATRNALTPRLAEDLAFALDHARRDPSVRAVILGGEGGSFCSGIDLGELLGMLGENAGPKQLRALSRRVLAGQLHGAIRALWHLPKPTVAAIEGAAAGFGLDLAAACDLRVVQRDAKLSYTFVRRGLVPDGGTGGVLPRIVGLGRALELVLLGDTFDGVRAEAIGFANRAVEAGEVRAEAERLARRMADNAPLAVAVAKARLKAGESLEEELGKVVELAADQAATADAMEGVAAFLEKRPPKFTGR
ncbi:MAG TPA: enoyl-CoA hydratase/isomerase family protein [Fredinandcohnia sp.]|nr:enoyl-CoA hydratase/isomerase family protein [Fredinandcohnia sp.]